MQTEAAATRSRQPKAAQPLPSAQESVVLCLSKIRSYLLLKILDILEPRRHFVLGRSLETHRSFEK